MLPYLRLATKLNLVTAFIGHGVAGLTVLMVLTTTVVVIARIAGTGSIAAQEAVTYMHAVVLSLTSAYTLQVDGHVRVDIFYRSLSVVGKAWVNTLGAALLLLPVAVFTVAVSYPYVASAWHFKEGSSDAGGIPAVYLLKSLILATGVLLTLQAVAELLLGLSKLSAWSDNDG